MKKRITLILYIALLQSYYGKAIPNFSNLKLLNPTEFIVVPDSDSVKVDINAPVISFDNRLYQQGTQIGTFDKKTSFKKGQLNVVIMIYNMEGKGVAEAIAAGVNASFAVTIYDGNEKISLDLSFEHEAEDFALKLRQLRKL